MDPLVKPYDLDLTPLEDESLLVLVQECDYRPAAGILLERHLPPLDRWATGEAQRSGLAPAEVEAVLWQMALAMEEAISRYRPQQPPGCRCLSFRRFVWALAADRFRDAVRHLRRGHRPAAVPSAAAQRRRAPSLMAAEDPGPSPCAVAEEEERVEGVRAVLGRLGDGERLLGEALAQGRGLREVAAVLGVAYVTVKRRGRQLQALLRQLLSGLSP